MAPGGGRFEIGGYGELQLRGLSDGFDANDWYLSQWAWILNVEPEWNIAPDGWGPFDSISAFARIEVRYDCVWTGCGLANSWRHFGNRARARAGGATGRTASPSASRGRSTCRRSASRSRRSSSNTSSPTSSRRSTRRAARDGGSAVDDRRGVRPADRRRLHLQEHRRRRGRAASATRSLRRSGPGGRSRTSGRTARSPKLPSHMTGLPIRPAIAEHATSRRRSLRRAARRLRLLRPELPPDRARVEPRREPGRVGAEGGLRRHRDVRLAALAPRRQADDRLGQDRALPEPGPVQPASTSALASLPSLEE